MGGLIGVTGPNMKTAFFMASPLWIPLLGLYFVGRFIWLIIRGFFRGLWYILRHISPIVRFVSRRTKKWYRYKGSVDTLPLYSVLEVSREKRSGSSTPATLTGPPSYGGHDAIDLRNLGPRSKFEQVFGDKTFPIRLVTLLNNSHCQDVSQLALTSRYMRSAILSTASGTHGPGLSDPGFLRVVSCRPGAKSQCWGCSIQICTGCSLTAKAAAPLTDAHLQVCEPRCSRCYLDALCSKESPTYKFRACRHGAGLSGGTQLRTVCASCAALSEKGLRERREAREAEELRHLARSSSRCGKCKRRLGLSGPRWWACCQCGKECTGEYHPSWRRPPAA